MASAVRDIANAVGELTKLVSPVGHNHKELEKKFDEVTGNFETLVNTEGAVPDLQVRPDAIDNNAAAFSAEHVANRLGDPLLLLFRTKDGLPAELFQAELRKQRGVAQEPATAFSS